MTDDTINATSAIVGFTLFGILGILVLVTIIRGLFKRDTSSTFVYHIDPQGTSHTICTRDKDFFDTEISRLQVLGWMCDGQMVMGGQRNSFFIQRMKRELPPSPL